MSPPPTNTYPRLLETASTTHTFGPCEISICLRLAACPSLHVQGLFSSSAARPYTRVLNRAQRATPDLYFLLLPPGSTTCFAHCALRSKLHYHLPRLAAAWGSEITGSGLSSPFPLLRSTKPYSDRAENFEANTHPYRIPPLLSSHTHLPPHLSSTGVF